MFVDFEGFFKTSADISLEPNLSLNFARIAGNLRSLLEATVLKISQKFQISRELILFFLKKNSRDSQEILQKIIELKIGRLPPFRPVNASALHFSQVIFIFDGLVSVRGRTRTRFASDGSGSAASGSEAEVLPSLPF